MPSTTFENKRRNSGSGRLARLFGWAPGPGDPIDRPGDYRATPPASLFRDQSGSPAIDFVIVFPVLIMFMAVVLDLSWAIFATHNLNKLVRDGARYAIVHGAASVDVATETSIQDYIRGRAVGMTAANINVTVTFAPDNAPGSSVTVHGDYAHQVLLDFWSIGPINLSAESKLVIFQ